MRVAVSTIGLVFLAAAVAGAQQGKPAAQKPAVGKFVFSRSNLAPSAAFTVTSTVQTPKVKQVQVFQVEVSGKRARLDFKDAALGEVRYLLNEKGTFFLIPANKAAQKMAFSLDEGLNMVFAQARTELAGATKTGTAMVSGQKTDVYKNSRTGTTIYLGTSPGFTLPVKLELKNSGGSRTLVASAIQLNKPISAARFALPPGTQVIDSQGAPPGGLPGIQ